MDSTTTTSSPSDESTHETITERVVANVAAATGTDPVDLEPLYYSVDPDCLEGLFGRDNDSRGMVHGHLAFTMEGCRVVVWADGTVDVHSADAQFGIPNPGTRLDGSKSVPESSD